MKVAVHDKEGRKFPNLALMKLSAFHKAQGDTVEWFLPMSEYDKIYSSSVFCYTHEAPYLPSFTQYGGIGYNLYENLPEAIEHILPDYSLYNMDYSLGFLTRGCVNSCDFCVVPRKEGKIHAHADLEEFVRHKKVIFLDNNVLASKHGIHQLEKIIHLGLQVDFNQGLDARQIDKKLAALLSKVHWHPYIRLACDSIAMLPIIINTVHLLRCAGLKQQIFVYVLIREIQEAQYIIEELRNLATPFAQPYRPIGDSNYSPPKDVKRLARWCNHKAVFKSCSFENYKG